jgi:ABC-type multidrug transport system ATPase subunit
MKNKANIIKVFEIRNVSFTVKKGEIFGFLGQIF